MKILSLFDGISCARVALEKAGIPIESYYASEIDKYAIQISEKNYPDIIQIGDIKKIEGDDGFTNSIDLLIGGSPCQDLSIAKKDRKGLDGERSGLFWEYVRILKEVKPKYFILENVASMPKEAKEIITQTLGVKPIMINASLVSAQNRKRLFWVGKYDGTKYKTVEIKLPEDKKIYLKDIIEYGFYNNGELVDDTIVIKQSEMVKVRKYPVDVESLKTLLREHKNTTNKEIAEKLNQPITLVEHWFRKDSSFAIPSEDIWFQLKELLQIKTDKFDKSIAEFEIREGKFDMSKRVYKINGKSPTLTTITGGKQKKIIDDNYQIRELTPIECERLQGLPDDYTEGVSNTQRYKMLGNAFNVDVIAHILSFIK